MESLTSDLKVPLRQWSELTDHDRQRYHELRLFFRQQQKDFLRERRASPFAGEIVAILSYIDRCPTGRDCRSIICGISCGGPLICVNTQQLKHLLGRCKSSINSCFQQIGYDVLRNRAKGRDAILAIIPAFRNDPGSIRQWTVRCATDACQSCFCSAFTPAALPAIAPGDFGDEKKPSKTIIAQPVVPAPAPVAAPLAIELPKRLPLRFDFGLGARESDSDDQGLTFPELPWSFSVDMLTGLDGPAKDDTLGGFFEEKKPAGNRALPRSESVNWGFVFHESFY
jgi:hypothetical protein